MSKVLLYTAIGGAGSAGVVGMAMMTGMIDLSGGGDGSPTTGAPLDSALVATETPGGEAAGTAGGEASGSSGDDSAAAPQSPASGQETTTASDDASVPPTGAETTTAETTDPAPEPTGPAAPRFDTVRAESDGSALVAGAGAPGAQLEVLVDGDAAASVEIGSDGKFVAFLDLPGGTQPTVLSLRMLLGDKEVFSEEDVIVAPVPQVAALVPEPTDTPQPAAVEQDDAPQVAALLPEADDVPRPLATTDENDAARPSTTAPDDTQQPQASDLDRSQRPEASDLALAGQGTPEADPAPGQPAAPEVADLRADDVNTDPVTAPDPQEDRAAAPVPRPEATELALAGQAAPEVDEAPVEGWATGAEASRADPASETPGAAPAPEQDVAAAAVPRPLATPVMPEGQPAPEADDAPSQGRVFADANLADANLAGVRLRAGDVNTAQVPAPSPDAVALPVPEPRTGPTPEKTQNAPEAGAAPARPSDLFAAQSLGEAPSLDDPAPLAGSAPRLTDETPPQRQLLAAAPSVQDTPVTELQAPALDREPEPAVDAPVRVAATDAPVVANAPVAGPVPSAPETADLATQDAPEAPPRVVVLAPDGLGAPNIAAPDDATSSLQTAALDSAPVQSPQPALPDSAPQAPSAPRVLISGPRGVEALQKAPLAPGDVALDSISYDVEGEVLLSGRGSDSAFVRVYLDNTPVTTSRIRDDGRWRLQLPEVDTGTYTLRVDQIDADGEVIARVESPFLREDPAILEELAAAGGPVNEVIIQPGNTLWAISRARYGEGMKYVRIFEANRDRIRNPDLIYPGQIFDLPDEAAAAN